MKKFLTIIQMLSLVMCIGMSAALGYTYWQEKQNIAVYEDCRLTYRGERSEQPEKTADDKNSAVEENGIDFDALHKQNKDVIGWITIPKTNIDYPIVQGTNNTHYLKYAYNGKRNWMGSIFMDYNNDSDLNDLNTVIYGHELSSRKTMFSQLNKYLSEDFWNEHKQFTIETDDKELHTYVVFSVYVSAAQSIAFNTSIDNENFSDFLQTVCEKSKYETDIVPTTDNKIVTLVCCYEKNFSKRVVVHGMQIS